MLHSPPPSETAMKPLRIDAHQHFWRYRADDYPWIGKGMELLACDRLPGQLHPVLAAEGLRVDRRAGPRRARNRFPAGPGAGRSPHRRGGRLGRSVLAAPGGQRGPMGTRQAGGLSPPGPGRSRRHRFLEAPAFNAGIKWLQQQGLVYDVLVYARQMAEVQAFCARHDATGWCWITWASRPWPTSAAAKLLQ
jgi:L-fuconolactonase